MKRRRDHEIARGLALVVAGGLLVSACGGTVETRSAAKGAIEGTPDGSVLEVQPPPASAQPTLPPPAHTPAAEAQHLRQGIDLSAFSGEVDWKEVASEGHGFAILKATEGVDLKDPAFDDHWPQVTAAGMVRGAYHFYVTEDDPHQQADFYISNVTLQPGDLVPIVDIELVGHGSPTDWQENVLTFVRRLEQHYGAAPIIYTGPTFWNEHFQGETAAALSAYPLWVAEYGVDAPTIPASWTEWHLWQYRGDQPVAGVEKDADLSRVNHQAVDPLQLLMKEP